MNGSQSNVVRKLVKVKRHGGTTGVGEVQKEF